MSKVTVGTDSVEDYTRSVLPWLSGGRDWDVPAIVRDVIDEYPFLIGTHDCDQDAGNALAFIDDRIDYFAFWEIVAKHRRTNPIDAAEIERIAVEIVADVREMQDAGDLPRSVSSFADLHDHMDANVQWDSTGELVVHEFNAVTDRVSELLASVDQ